MGSSKNSTRGAQERSIEQLRQMSGNDFAMEVAGRLVHLAKDERGQAIRMLTALHETINRESAVTAK